MSTSVDQFLLEHFETELVSPETILRASIGVLPDPLLPRAGRLSYRIGNDVARDRAQRCIRLRFGDANEEAQVASLLEQISGSGEPAGDRAEFFVDLVSWLPMPLSEALAARALAFVESLDDETVRTQALRALAPHLPEPAKDDVFGKVLVMTRTPRYHVGLQNLQHLGYNRLAFLPGFNAFEVALHKFVAALSESDRLKLFSRALDIAEKRLAPSPPETPAPAPELGGLESTIVRPPHQRVVNTGFAQARLPGDGLERCAALMPGLEYLFWVEIGEQLATSIEVRPTALPIELLPAEARLHVVVFGFDGELEPNREADVGEIQLTPDGLARVVRQPIADAATSLISDRLDRCLYFPVRAPKTDGEFRLRCNIYCQQVLVQSRLVTAPVRAMPVEEFPEMQSVVDYTLTESLNLTDVAALRPHGFSLMINGNDDTHQFRFFGTDGADPIPRDISLPADTVKDWIDEGRGRLRKVSWNDVEEWDAKKHQFRYESATSALSGLGAAARDSALTQLTSDLARLAVGGYRIYHELSKALGASHDAGMEGMIRRASAVQIAIRMADRLVFPAALVYDYHWDTNKFAIDSTTYAMCPQFRAAILSGTPLEACGCFGDSCPVRIKGDALRGGAGLLEDLGPLICPSGFWGFRHALGMPLTLTPAEKKTAAVPADAPGFIFFPDKPHVAAGISTDPELKRFKAHAGELKKRVPNTDWRDAQQTRSDVLKMLTGADVQIIYFYCHGGVLGKKTPFLSVGQGEAPITPDNVPNVQWARSNPLVFINGCHTTALDPAKALDFVSTFVDARAGGVVGTEITISESLACAFAEECLSRFLIPGAGADDGQTIGQAVRSARLALLQMGNPLGLVYIPFAVESLRLKRKAA